MSETTGMLDGRMDIAEETSDFKYNKASIPNETERENKNKKERSTWGYGMTQAVPYRCA